jgi:hypothetical protein
MLQISNVTRLLFRLVYVGAMVLAISVLVLRVGLVRTTEKYRVIADLLAFIKGTV